MQDINELPRDYLELLNQQVAKLEAERDSIQQDVQDIRLLLAQRDSKKQWRHTTAATVSVLSVIALSFVFVYHNALSNVNTNDQSEESAISVLKSARIMRTESPGPTASPKAATSLQWGPSLVIPEPSASKRHSVFDPVVKQQQENLLTLGFDIGKADGFSGERTRQAMAEFRALYLPDSGKQLADADLAIIIKTYADLARSDAARFGIDHGIVAAIRLSSVRTGVDFSYLMKLAAAESNFKPASEAATSSATGLYQFTHDTWLNTLKTYGAKYGLVGNYAASIEYNESRDGYQRPVVHDKSIYQHLLALRKNPRISAIMAAETVRDNQQILAYSLDREPTQTDLYLTHFLGTDEAINFLRSLEQSPDTHAVELFPRAASSNRSIFHPKASGPRTIDEVYAFFGKKFTTRRYDDIATN